MKKCSKCWIKKDYNFFRKDKSKKDWYYPSCTDCYRIRTWSRKIWTFDSPRKTHWLSGKRIYRVYQSIKDRCSREKNEAYKNYWWRWIVCEWWSFEDFFRDMWSWFQEWLEIDRKDVDWNYNKENCRWVDLYQQARNKRNVRKFLYKGESLTIPEISIKYWIKVETLRKRIYLWYSIEDAIETPMHKNSWRNNNQKSWDQ